MFSKSNCPYCDSAKALLDSKNIRYNVIDITQDSSAKEFVIEQGHKTVPQLYIMNDAGTLELLVDAGYIGLYKMTDEELFKKIND